MEFAPKDGNTHRRWVEHGDEKALVVTEQYVGDIRDNCIAMQNEGKHGSKDMKLAGSIPTAIVDHYCAVNQISLREFMRNGEHWRRLLYSPEFADFRVYPGRL